MKGVSMVYYLVALLCVVGLSIGQILFKLSALSLNADKSLLSVAVLATFLSAVILYGVTSIAWVWVLQKVPLVHVYPLMSLAFLLVPIGSYWFLDEKINVQYFFGTVLLMLGIVVIARS